MARTEIPLLLLNPDTGEFLPGAEIRVFNRSDSSAATIWQTETNNVALTQPILTDAQGRVDGWLDRGSYRIEITATGFPVTNENYDSAPGSNSAIDSNWLGNASIVNSKIADGAVSTVKLEGSAVTQAKIADSAVGSAQVQDGSIGDSELANNISGSKLADLSTPYTKLNLSGGVVNADINASAGIAHSKLAPLATGQVIVGNAGTPTARTLSGDATVNATGVLTLNANSVDANKLANNAVDNAAIVNGAVDNSKIADGTITSAKYAAFSVTPGKFFLSGGANTAGSTGALGAGTWQTVVSVTGLTNGAFYLCIANATIFSSNQLQLRCTSGGNISGTFSEAGVAGGCAAGATLLQASGSQIDLQVLPVGSGNAMIRTNLVCLRYF